MDHQALAPAIQKLVTTLKSGYLSDSRRDFMTAMIGIDGALFIAVCLQTVIGREALRTIQAIGAKRFIAVDYVVRIALIPLLIIAVALYGINLANGHYDRGWVDLGSGLTGLCGLILFLRTAVIHWVASATTRRAPHLAPEIASPVSVYFAFFCAVAGLVLLALTVVVNRSAELQLIGTALIGTAAALAGFDPFGWLDERLTARNERARTEARAEHGWQRVTATFHYQRLPIPLSLYLTPDDKDGRWAVDLPDAAQLGRNLEATAIYVEDRGSLVDDGLTLRIRYRPFRMQRLEIHSSHRPEGTVVATYERFFRAKRVSNAGLLCRLDGQREHADLLRLLCDYDPALRVQLRQHIAPVTPDPLPASVTPNAERPVSSQPGSTLAEISYTEAVRGLEVQERGVDQFRARTGMLLAASSLSSSFLGAQTIQHERRLGVAAVVALAFLVVSVGLCVYLLLGKRKLVFSLSGSQIYESLYEFRDDPEETHRRLAYWLEGFWQDNQRKIDSLWWYFVLAAGALIVQLICWTWALTTNIK